MSPFDSATGNIFLNVNLLLLSIAFLWKGADLLVDSASRIAAKLGISDLVIGLTVVAFGTSAPEFAVTINAALKGHDDISIGNIVGSNIFNLGFILGAVAIVRSIATTRKLVYRDGMFMVAITFLLLLFFHDLKLQRHEGVIMMTLLAGYLALLFLKKEEREEDVAHETANWRDGPLLAVSIAVVVTGGHFLVESASFLATSAGISPWVIAVTIVAAGTSAPEMATSLAAAVKGKHGMSAGNLIGSDIFNLLGVLGLAGLIRPMSIPATAYNSLFMLCGMVLLVVFFMRTGWRITRTEGAVLFGIGVLRWIVDFLG